MMNSIMLLVLLLGLAQYSFGFQQSVPRIAVPSSRYTSSSSSTTQLFAVNYDVVATIGFGVSVPKPLGVVFGENPDPYFGLMVDDVSEGLNAAVAGIRVGDQLLAVNGEVVVGQSFDSIMSMLQSAPGSLDLVMYRGPVAAVYTILSNQIGEDEDVRDEEEGDDEVIVMDENYESPVKVEVKEQKPLTPGDFLKAFKKVGEMIMEEPAELKDKPKEPKKNTGFFGIGGESIQLDGDDAKGYK